MRDKKHNVYRLPNGKNVVTAKTPSDFRAARNSLNTLKKTLGEPITRVEQHFATTPPEQVVENVNQLLKDLPATGFAPEGITRALEENQPMSSAIQVPLPPTPPPPPPAVEQQRVIAVASLEPLTKRVEDQIASLTAQYEALISEASKVERNLNMLKALKEYAGDERADVVLANLLPPPPPPPAPEPIVVVPPPVIETRPVTERIQITRQLVLVATQARDDDFTINDLVDQMTEHHHVDLPEKMRIRSSVSSAMFCLLERGEVERSEKGNRGKQALWRRVPMKGGAASARAN